MSETIKHRGFSIKIENDEHASNPRTEWDNVGKMICWHSRYSLGDVNESKQYSDHEDFLYKLAGVDIDEETKTNAELFEIISKSNVIMPLFLYDHSGITMSTSNGYPYNDRWDSMTVGFIYASYETILKEWGEGAKEITDEIKAKGIKYLEGEVETYDMYIRGDVYGYTVEELGDSCWGFYGYKHEESGLLEQARAIINCHISAERESHFNQLKKWIKSKVAFQYRKPLDYALA